ncbi:MAG: peptide chain release factor N(5)-glutamine methyltransferase [Prolixibacteraceae bacterium]
MRAAIASIRKELADTYAKTEIDSLIFLIFEKLKGYSRTQFLMAADEVLDENERLELQQIMNRLKNQEPIQYILGVTEFYGLPFYAVHGVLIPRPETEELVQWIIQENKLPNPTILDIGTGTGCIPVSLRKNIADSRIMACDISPVCIETARRNAELNGCDISIIEYDILNDLPETNFPELDIMVSNPPYVRESERQQMEENVLSYEPELALFVPDDDPLLFYRRIANFARRHLKNGGSLYFEINEAFGAECVEMLRENGFTEISLRKDIHGKDRMVRSVYFRSEQEARNAIQ